MTNSADKPSESISMEDLISFLAATEFFGLLPPESLKELASKFETLSILSGETLIKEGEKGDCLFLVISGRLRTLKHGQDQEDAILNEIGNGELIGELALLTQAPRAATVIAIRDSLLLKLSQQSFEAFIQAKPLQMMPIVRSAITRILHSKEIRYGLSTIAIGPAGNNERFKEFAAEFAKELSKYGSTLYLDKEQLQALLPKEHYAGFVGAERNDYLLINWLSKQESQYNYIVYVTDDDYSPWTQRCIRQADRILLICDTHREKLLNQIEQEIFKQKKSSRKYVDLILLHQTRTVAAGSTKSWLALRKVNGHHHLEKNSLTDLHRLIRIVTGKSIALVLAGGGARALTYIGIYKALNELGIPIDMVAGTSFGALMGCYIAMNFPPEYIIQNMKKYILDNKKLFSYTMPILSFNSGQSLTESIQAVSGKDNCIEDIWKYFFCIICNLSAGVMDVRRKGLVWKALRATVSLPAIFPPISNEDGQLLVDGSVLNNLPVDVMKRVGNPGQIIAVSTSIGTKKRVDIPDGIMSGWHLLLDRYLKHHTVSYPSIYEIILSSIVAASKQHEQAMIAEANYSIKINTHGLGLFDYQGLEKLIDIGYQAAMKELSQQQTIKVLG